MTLEESGFHYVRVGSDELDARELTDCELCFEVLPVRDTDVYAGDTDLECHICHDCGRRL